MAKLSRRDKSNKKYQLTANDARLLVFTKQHHDAIFSALLSNIAGTKLGYNVTQNTQFNLNGDFSEVVIEELNPDQPPEQPPEQPEEGDSPVKTA